MMPSGPARRPAAARPAAARTAAVAAVAGLLLLVGPAASAHVTVDPPAAAAGALVQLTFTVPNEKPDQDTIGLDLALPKGFLLESAQDVPGWTTAVETAADKTPTAVHWTGGRSAPSTFVTFAIRGRLPTGGSTAQFTAVQRYTGGAVTWSAADPTADDAAPVVTLGAVVKGLDGFPAPSSTAAATVPAAAAAGAGGADDLARSRAALALALAMGALLLALGSLGGTVLLRRSGGVTGAQSGADGGTDGGSRSSGGPSPAAAPGRSVVAAGGSTGKAGPTRPAQAGAGKRKR